MVRVLVVAVLPSLAVPLQFLTRQPAVGAAVNVIACPAVYWPVAQPVELAGSAAGSLPLPLWLRESE